MLDASGYAALCQIYAAPLKPGGWRAALDAVAAAIGAEAVALHVRPPDASRDRHLLSSRLHAFSRSAWGLYYGMRLGHLQNGDWERLRRWDPHRLVPDAEGQQAEAQLDARADYRFLRKRLGLGRRIAVRLNADRAWLEGLSIALARDRPRMSPAGIDQARALIPHLAKAIETDRMLSRLRHQRGELPEAFNQLGIGAAIARLTGEIVFENPEARRILSRGDGLKRMPEGHFHCDAPDQSARLHAAIALACETARGAASVAASRIDLRRASGRAPLLIEVTPLRDDLALIGDARAAALITVIDPDRTSVIDVDRFAAAYGLNPDQKALCSALIERRSLSGIAGETGSTPSRVRNDIAALLASIGAADRSALIRLIVQVIPPVI